GCFLGRRVERYLKSVTKKLRVLGISFRHAIAYACNQRQFTPAIANGGFMKLKEVGTIDEANSITDLTNSAVEEISNVLRRVFADVFALYLKRKNFHWHMSGRHFRDYHLLLDEHASQIFEMTDDIAERARKIGGLTLHSISDISRNQRLKDNNQDFVKPEDM